MAPSASVGFRQPPPRRPGGSFAYSFNLPPGVEGGEFGETESRKHKNDTLIEVNSADLVGVWIPSDSVWFSLIPRGRPGGCFVYSFNYLLRCRRRRIWENEKLETSKTTQKRKKVGAITRKVDFRQCLRGSVRIRPLPPGCPGGGFAYPVIYPPRSQGSSETQLQGEEIKTRTK